MYFAHKPDSQTVYTAHTTVNVFVHVFTELKFFEFCNKNHLVKWKSDENSVEINLSSSWIDLKKILEKYLSSIFKWASFKIKSVTVVSRTYV